MADLSLIVAAAALVVLVVMAALYLGARRSGGGGRHRAADRPSYRRDMAPYLEPAPAPVAAGLEDTVLLGRVVWDVLDSHGGGERL